MKILQVVPYFYPAWAYGGIVRVVYELSRELVRKGHDVTVFTTDVFDEHSRLPGPSTRTGGVTGANVEGISVFYFHNVSNRLAFQHQLFLPYRMLGQTRKSVKRFDVVHMHGHRHLLNSIVHRRAVAERIPYVFSAHGTLPRIERRQFAKRIFDGLTGTRVLRDAAHYTAVSQAEVKQYEAFGIPPYRVAVTYNGIDVPAYSKLPSKGALRKQLNVPEDAKLVAYLGKITRRKGLDVLVNAFEKLDGEHWRLVIAGSDHGWGAELDRRIAALPEPVRSRVTRIGHVDEARKMQLLVDADVLAYPSTLEVFGLVPFEALMCGTPVIVTDDNGCGEIIRAADGGRLVPYGDAEALHAAILQTIDNPTETARQIGLGRAHILENLAWPTVSERVLGVYETVVSHH